MLETTDFFVIGMDVIGYSQYDQGKQYRIQVRMDDTLKKTMNQEKFKKIELLHWVDGGDGGFLLFKGENNNPIEIIEDFTAKLKEDNIDRMGSEYAMRYAIHEGTVRYWNGAFGHKFAGVMINNCARLLSGMPQDVKNVVVCSESYKSRITGYDDQNVVLQRLRDVEDKHENSHEMWNLYKLPCFGAEVAPKYLHPDLVSSG